MDTNRRKISEFMKLYAPVQRQLSAYCRVITRSEEEALDLVQETLTKAFESFDTLREPSAFQFFLIGIARNCYRKQQRRSKFFGKPTEVKAVNVEVAPDSVEMQHDIQLIRECISRLNAEQREVILLFHILGFSIKEIAVNLNITEAAVKNRLARGREKLRKLLSDNESILTHRISANPIKTLTK